MPISKINTSSITDNSVTAGKIVAGAVDADIAAGSIDTAQIADDAVTTDKLANAINTSIAAKLPLAGGTMTGVIAGFESTGIDDNATSTAITIDASENVGIGTASPNRQLNVENTLANSGGVIGLTSSDSSTTGSLGIIHFGNSTDTSLASINGIADGSTSSGALLFKTEVAGGSIDERMRIDSLGNVGINTATPEAYSFEIRDKSIRISKAASVTAYRIIGNDVGNDLSIQSSTTADGSLYTTRFNIANNGTVKVGGSTSATTGYYRVESYNAQCMLSARNGTDGHISMFYKGGAFVGSIQVNGSSTSYGTSSDYRLKENVTPMSGATAKVKLLKPCNFDWISTGQNVDGFLAHEVADVVPVAASGIKDAMMDEEYEVTPAVVDDEGVETTAAVMGTRSVPDYQTIDQSKLVPLLTATIQELIASIETQQTTIESLTTRITALEDA